VLHPRTLGKRENHAIGIVRRARPSYFRPRLSEWNCPGRNRRRREGASAKPAGRFRLSKFPADPDPDCARKRHRADGIARRPDSPTARAELLERVGLAERVSHLPTQLSGGEQQRVALARAFINKPLVLFADEPTGNLDAETSRSVIDIMLELNSDSGTTLVLVTHDPEVACLTEKTIRLRNGEMVQDGA
jgi:ABC-type antimicrobial peptide transport system, ATPase component